MRKFLLAATLLLAATAVAEDFGPLRVTLLPSLSATTRTGSYTERRIAVLNRTAEPHQVQLRLSLPEGLASSGSVRKTIAVPPRAQMRVTMLQLVSMPELSRLEVIVDGGSSFDGSIPFSDGTAYTDVVLVGRSVNDVQLRAAFIPTRGGDNVSPVRSSVAPAEWSTDWIAYDGFSAIVLSHRDWDEFPPAVQAAILRWVRAGGALTYVPAADARKLPKATHKLTHAWVGFGHILESSADLGTLSPTLLAKIFRTWAAVPVRFQRGDMRASLPLLESRGVPTRSFLLGLIAFAILIGPVSLVTLAKKERRVWIFWIVPLAGGLCATGIVVATMAAEGIHRIVNLASITLLDQRSGEAATIGTTGFYCTLPPEGKIRFAPGTEVRPFEDESPEIDLTDGQHFSNFVESRVERYALVRRSEPRRERIVFRRGAELTAVNGLGGDIDDLYVLTLDGVCYHARNVAAGAQRTLQQVPTPTPPVEMDAYAQLTAEPSSWAAQTSRIIAQPHSILRPGTYVATLRNSPFIEQPLEGASRATRRGVVIGTLDDRGGSDAR